MSPKTSRRSTTTETTSLALSNVYVQLDALEKEHQSLLKQIKRKRTEVQNFIEKMRSLGSEIVSRTAPGIQRMAELDQEIHDLFNRIFLHKKFGKRTRSNVEKVYLNLQLTGIISRKYLKEPWKETPDNPTNEDNPQEKQNYQYYARHEEQTNHTGGRTDESRKVRQTFLKLAEVFHPDKVQDSQTQNSYTEIMKEINKAYQEGDLARLLEIERQYELGESIDQSSEDDLVHRCKIVEQQNTILKDQYEKLKRELRRVKNSPEGQTVADSRKTAKMGIDYVEVMLKTIETQGDIIEQIRDFVQGFAEDKISVQDFLTGPSSLGSFQETALLEIFEQMMENHIF